MSLRQSPSNDNCIFQGLYLQWFTHTQVESFTNGFRNDESTCFIEADGFLELSNSIFHNLYYQPYMAFYHLQMAIW